MQIPKALGGVEGEALFIDSQGDFNIERLHDMGKNLRACVLKRLEKEAGLLKQYKESFSLEKILSKVHYIRICDEG